MKLGNHFMASELHMRHTQGDMEEQPQFGTFKHISWHYVVSQLRFIVLAALPVGKSNAWYQINMQI
jgi:hypothetical protein